MNVNDLAAHLIQARGWQGIAELLDALSDRLVSNPPLESDDDDQAGALSCSLMAAAQLASDLDSAIIQETIQS